MTDREKTICRNVGANYVYHNYGSSVVVLTVDKPIRNIRGFWAATKELAFVTAGLFPSIDIDEMKGVNDE